MKPEFERLTRHIDGLVQSNHIKKIARNGRIFETVASDEEIRNRLAEYEDTGLSPEEIVELNDFINSQTAKLLAELQEYKRLEEQGLIVRLPCKVGTEVWRISSRRDCETCQVSEAEGCGWCRPTLLYTISQGQATFEEMMHFGKTIFLTREEAEKALELNSNDNRN